MRTLDGKHGDLLGRKGGLVEVPQGVLELIKAVATHHNAICPVKAARPREAERDRTVAP